jgi:outer membrane protein OmpA-like peptidoglycan-associated protein
MNVVGHTDSVGGIDSNMKLSQACADAVVQALTGKHGIEVSGWKARPRETGRSADADRKP